MYETDMAGKSATKNAAWLKRYAMMIHQDAEEHGLFDDYGEQPAKGENYRDGEWQRFDMDDIAEWRRELYQVILREAWEAEQAIDVDEDFGKELADIVIACMSVATHCHIDIGGHIERKRLANIFRPYGHKEGNDNG